MSFRHYIIRRLKVIFARDI